MSFAGPALAALRRPRPGLPHGVLDLVWQFALVAVAYYLWRQARGAVHFDGSTVTAMANANDIVAAERWMHSFVEVDIQNWTVGAEWPRHFAAWMYSNAHFNGSLLMLGLIYFAHNRSFCFVRNALIAAMAISVLCYAFYPTAPPRFMPELGFSGEVAVTGNKPIQFSSEPLFNPYAAVPSMHVGLACLFGFSLALLSRAWPIKAAFMAYPLLMTFVVIATGNHWWLDAIAGVAVAGLAFGVALVLARVGPERWSFRPGPHDAEVPGPATEPGVATA